MAVFAVGARRCNYRRLHYGDYCICRSRYFEGAEDQRVSSAWIDALRAELAEFASQARRLAHERTPFDLRRAERVSFIEQMEAENEEIRRPDPLLVNRTICGRPTTSLRLRLNPGEDDHRRFLSTWRRLFKTLNESAESERPDNVATELDAGARVAQIVLKREWVRVKAGEPLYRLTLGIAGGLATALGVGRRHRSSQGLIEAYGAT